TMLGEFAEARERAEEAVRGAEAVGHPYTLIHAYGVAGDLSREQGDMRRATPLLEQALSLCEAGHFPALWPTPAAALGIVYLRTGRGTEGLQLLERALERALSIQMLQNHWWLSLRLAEGYVLMDRLTDAEASARRALTLSREGLAGGCEAATLQLL